MDFVDRTLALIQDNKPEYYYYFQWVKDIHVEINDYTGETVDTGSGIMLFTGFDSGAGTFALDKEMVLEWAQEEGVI